MMYNLLVMNARSGLSITSIKLAEDGINERDGVLMSGIVQAIKLLLKELNMGEIHTFQTHEKKVIIYQEGQILSALVCDENDNSDLYYPKIKYVTNLFSNKCDFENWCGEIDIFNDEIETAKKIMPLNDEELIMYLSKSMKNIMKELSNIYGYRILNNNKIVDEFFKDNDDFELSSCFESEIFSLFIKHKNEFIDVIANTIPEQDLSVSFMSYNRFSLYCYHFLGKLLLYIFLPGRLDPLADLEQLNMKIQSLGAF